MGRAILAIVAGCVLSLLVVAGVDTLGHMIYPPPAGADLRDPAAMRVIIAEMPFGAFVIVVSGWILGAGLGAWVATRLSRTAKAWPGGAVGAVTLAATGINLFTIAHPVWVVIAALIGIPLATWVGIRVGQPTPPAMTTARAA
jgi:sorbitol-specific phosphotransferase system component IIBC